MSFSFSELKKSSKTSLSNIRSEVEKLSTKGFANKDEGFWQPTVDKAGNGYAVIRFLPPAEGEEIPFIRRYNHGFKGPTGKWYIEESLTSIGKDDPVSDYNSKLWAQGENSEGRKIVTGNGSNGSGTKRRLYYTANIYVVTDTGNPDNEGKVFLYKFGKKIFDKLNDAMHPKFVDETPLNPFDLWAGANFKLKIQKVDGHRSYDKSDFAAAGPLLDDEKAMEKIWAQEKPLLPFMAETEYKAYEELQRKLDQVMGGSPVAEKPAPRLERREEPRAERPKSKVAEPETETGTDDDDDDASSFFQRLATSK
jgi:hypothetical protein